MKLSEAADVGRTSTPLLNGDFLNSSNLHGNEEPILPVASHGENGQSSISMAGTIANGNVSLGDHSDDVCDINDLGAEVESYDDLNLPASPGHLSHEDFNSIHRQDSESRMAKNNSAEQFRNEKCGSDSEATHDSSHLSEEFQLRLSEDDDHSEETVLPIITSVCSANDGVSQNLNESDEVREDQPGSGNTKDMKSTGDSMGDDKLINTETVKEDDHTELLKVGGTKTTPAQCSIQDAKPRPVVEDLSEENSSQSCPRNNVDSTMTESVQAFASDCEADGLAATQSSDPSRSKTLCGSAHQKSKEDDEKLIEEDQLLNGDNEAGSEAQSHVPSSLSTEEEAELEAQLEAEIAAQTDATETILSLDAAKVKQEDSKESIELNKPDSKDDGVSVVNIKQELKEELIEEQLDLQFKVEREERVECKLNTIDFVKIESKHSVLDSVVKKEDCEYQEHSKVKTEVAIKCEADFKMIPVSIKETATLVTSESPGTIVSPTTCLSSTAFEVVHKDMEVPCGVEMQKVADRCNSIIENLDPESSGESTQNVCSVETSVTEKACLSDCNVKDSSPNGEFQRTEEIELVLNGDSSVSVKTGCEKKSEACVATLAEVSSSVSEESAGDGHPNNNSVEFGATSAEVSSSVNVGKTQDDMLNDSSSTVNPLISLEKAKGNVAGTLLIEAIPAAIEKAEDNVSNAKVSEESMSEEKAKDFASATTSEDGLTVCKERAEDAASSQTAATGNLKMSEDEQLKKPGNDVSENQDEMLEDGNLSIVRENGKGFSATDQSCILEEKEKKTPENDCSRNTGSQETEMIIGAESRLHRNLESDEGGSDHPNASRGKIIGEGNTECEQTSSLSEEVNASLSEDALESIAETAKSSCPVSSAGNLMSISKEQHEGNSHQDVSLQDGPSNEEQFARETSKSPQHRSPLLGKNFGSPDPDSHSVSDSENFDDSGNDNGCDNEISNSEDDTDAEDKSDSNSSRVLRRNTVSCSEFPDSNISISPTFCESVLDTSPADDMDSQDFTSSSNANRNSKDGCSFLSRKRTLSPSDDDSWDSGRTKKINGFSGRFVTTEAHDGLKRSGELNFDSDPKKLRISDRSGSGTDNCDTESSGIFSKADPEGSKTDSSNKEPSFRRGTHSSTTAPELSFLSSFHREELSSLSRSDLEELVVQKICEAITERSIAGELRRKCDILEQRQEREAERFQKLHKQMNELNIVLKKFLDNQKQNTPAPPIKVTRSVGLQVSPHLPTPIRYTTQSVHPYFLKEQNCAPYNRPVSRTPPRPSLASEPQKTPNKITKGTSYSPRVSNVIISTDPPALVPSSSSSSPVVPMSARPTLTPPRVPMPPLQQISSTRPRINSSVSISTTSQPRPTHPSPLRQNPPQNQNPPPAANKDVEVIDIVEVPDKDDPKKRPGAVQLSSDQMLHQQKQAANAVAQSLSGNSGLTVRLISPGQSGTVQSFPQMIVPQRFIANASQQGANGVRGNVKFVMKSNSGSLFIPMQSNLGAVSVAGGMVHIPTNQPGVQQIFTTANSGIRTSTVATVRQSPMAHPAPLPALPSIQISNPGWKQIPPRPNLKCQLQNNGIVLSWNMVLTSAFADIENYQIFAYQENSAPPNSNLWKKVGDVKALPLPMACTLTQFVPGHRYHFTVRAVDKHGRIGPFSQQSSIRLGD